MTLDDLRAFHRHVLPARACDAARRRRCHTGKRRAAARARVRRVEGLGSRRRQSRQSPDGGRSSPNGRSTSSTSPARRSRRFASVGWACRARRPTTRRCRCSTPILGGSFTSRLNTNLRETHGYSYGAFSGFEERISPGAFSARAGVQTDKTAEALKEFFNELAGILKPIPGDELDKAKNYVALGFPAEFESTGDLAQKMEEQVVHSLPDEYFPSYIRSVVQVTGPASRKRRRATFSPTSSRWSSSAIAK